MLSVLISCYNYNATALVNELYSQCLECAIVFEILVNDDCSKSKLNIENQKINLLNNCKFYENQLNVGRGGNINKLVAQSKYINLLILDCDTMPRDRLFIKKYLDQIKNNVRLVFGGIIYQDQKPDKDKMLRWVYGRDRESLFVTKRLQNPNQTLTSNLLINKKIFDAIKFDSDITIYGYEDLVFLKKLAAAGQLVHHIDNPTFHLGLETSALFLKKTQIALSNLKQINSKMVLDTKVTRVYNFINKIRLARVVAFLFKKIESKLEKNLLSNNPNILLFDIFKIGFYCQLNHSK